MPTVPADAPRVTRKFYDMEFSVPYIFSEGHALTAPEAVFLNANLASVIGNAYSGDIRRAVLALNEEGEKAFIAAGGKKKDYTPLGVEALGWDHQAKFADKFASYDMGVTRQGGGTGASTSSPLERMITFLAGEDLKAKFAKKSMKVSPFYKAEATEGSGFKSKWAELLAGNIERNIERFTAAAEAQLASMAEADAEDDGLLDGIEAPEEVPQAAE